MVQKASYMLQFKTQSDVTLNDQHQTKERLLMRSNPATVVIVRLVGMLMKKTWRVYLVLALLTMAVLLWESPSWAQSYRYGLPRSSVEMNRMLLTYARGNRFESIEALLPLYEPLLDAFKSKFGQDVKSEIATALASRDGSALRLSVHHLIPRSPYGFRPWPPFFPHPKGLLSAR